MKPKKTMSGLLVVSRVSPYVLVAAIAVGVVLFGGLEKISQLLDRVSEYPAAAIPTILFLFGLKSISFGIPFAFLYFSTGSMFPLGWALAINLLGILVNLQAPYWFGKKRGLSLVETMSKRYPRFARLVDLGGDNGLFVAFLVKFVGKIPHEITNMLLGAMRIPYHEYLAGSMLGLLPVMVTSTLVGNALDAPTSISFLVSIALLVLLTVVSLLVYRKKVH